MTDAKELPNQCPTVGTSFELLKQGVHEVVIYLNVVSDVVGNNNYRPTPDPFDWDNPDSILEQFKDMSRFTWFRSLIWKVCDAKERVPHTGIQYKQMLVPAFERVKPHIEYLKRYAELISSAHFMPADISNEFLSSDAVGIIEALVTHHNKVLDKLKLRGDAFIALPDPLVFQMPTSRGDIDRMITDSISAIEELKVVDKKVDTIVKDQHNVDFGKKQLARVLDYLSKQPDSQLITIETI